MKDDFETSVFLIRNKSNEEKRLIQFLEELQEVEPLCREYPHFRLHTDTYGVWPRDYEAGKIYEVKFVVDVCILGRMMNKIPNYGELPSFSYIKIKDGYGFMLPDGDRIEDPYTKAVREATKFLLDEKSSL
jgi:hypothetical protein